MRNKNKIFFLGVAIGIFILMFFLKGDIFAVEPDLCCPAGRAHDGYWVGGCCFGCGSYSPPSACPKACCSTVGEGCGFIPCEGPYCDPEDPPPPPPPEPCVRCTPSCPNLSTSTVTSWLLGDLGGCSDTGGCTDYHPLNCYETPSNQPNASLVINPEQNPTTKGFISTTHTGAGSCPAGGNDDCVNEPINMVATYWDTTSAEIEALYVWFKQENTTPITPKYIDLDNSESAQERESQSNSQFGFLIHKHGSSWAVDQRRTYVPGFQTLTGNGAGDRWLRASDSGLNQDNEFFVWGPNETDQFVKVRINSITENASTKQVIMNFDVYFNGFTSQARDGQYHVFLKANDTFGFTPYDNYDSSTEVRDAIRDLYGREEIRLYSAWINSSKVWNVDLNPPDVAFVCGPEGSSNTKIKCEWTFSDGQGPNFRELVINLYKSSDLRIPASGFDITNIDSSGTNKVLQDPFIPEDVDDNNGNIHDDMIGDLREANNRYLLKVSNENGDGKGSITLNLGDVGQGYLYFYVFAFDKGGNIGSKSPYEVDLRDWVITQGGLLYSRDININTERGDEPTAWPGITFLNLINHNNADVSTELVGKGSNGALSSPSKWELTRSFMIRPYLIQDPNGGYYNTLKGFFDGRRESLPIKELGNIPSLSGDLSNYAGGVGENQIAVGETVGTLTVSNNFNCNRQGVFFVQGNLSIGGRITNQNFSKDACIFVVSGDVNIGYGTKANNATLAYDEINMYLLTDGNIVINKELASDAVFDGLYISGGIHTLKDNVEAIRMERTLKVADRLRYPALVVNHHSKYGILGGRIFGFESKVQQIEVGITPY